MLVGVSGGVPLSVPPERTLNFHSLNLLNRLGKIPK